MKMQLTLATLLVVGSCAKTPTVEVREGSDSDVKDFGRRSDLRQNMNPDLAVGFDARQDLETIPCSNPPPFTGQIGGMGDNDGGIFSTTPYAEDSNIETVLLAAPSTPDDPDTGIDEGLVVLAGALTVNNVTVTATRGLAPNERFYIQDARVGMEVFLEEQSPVRTMKVGDRVSFDVTAIRNFANSPQIARFDNLVVESQQNPVYVRDVYNQQLLTRNYKTLVQTHGLLGPGTPCGGASDCYEFTHGDQTTTLRSPFDLTGQGDCLIFVGPQNSFQVGQNDEVNQLDAINSRWVQLY